MLNLDTHILVFSLTGALSAGESRLIAQAECGISGIVLWEIQMLALRGRISMDLDHPVMVEAIRRLHIWPITREVCRAIGRLDFDSDPANELIAATSLERSVPLLTRDRTIRKSRVVPLAA